MVIEVTALDEVLDSETFMYLNLSNPSTIVLYKSATDNPTNHPHMDSQSSEFATPS
jgi:hypothetical protein